MGVRICITIIFFSLWHSVQSQCPVTNFSSPSTVCLLGNISLSNSSDPGTYDWDYCSGDLNNTPSAQNLYTLSSAIGRPGIELVKDGTRWIGFVTGTFTNTLYRLEFANGLAASPTLTENLGNLGGKLNQPGSIRIVNQSGLWFGIIHNTATGELLLLSFGNSLTNSITTSVLFNSMGSSNEGLAIANDGVNGWVCVLSVPGEKFQIIKFGSDLTTPAVSSISTPSVPNSSLMLDVDLIRYCDQWFGFATNLGTGRIFRLAFGTNLFQQPVIDQVTDLGGINGGRIRALKEGASYFLTVATLNGPFFKVALGNDPASTTPILTNEGNFGSLLQNSFGLAVVKENSVWSISVVDQGSGKVNAVQYPNSCSSIVVDGSSSSPLIKYSQSGNYTISLTTTNSSGISSSLVRNISISASVAPDIDFSSQNSCAGNAVNFSETNASGNITMRSWDFGDSQSASSFNPSHVYASAGTYQVKLTVTANNACTNFSGKTISIYNAPVADFSLPAVSPVCTNQNYLFANSSTFDALSNPAWEWRLNGVLVSTQQNFSTVFNNNAAQQIRLKALIPGCENEATKNIAAVVTGPVVNFSVSDGCQNSPIAFTNSSSGADAGYSWSFGDAGSSTIPNPTHAYASAGTFQATLTAGNSAGCQNFTTKPVKIYSKPVPDFSVGLPPFSCNNSVTPFQNNTPTLSDSNISSWTWQFGDATPTSGQQNPSHTYSNAGSFSVSLTALSDKGCSSSLSKSISIAQSPVADFSNSAACVNFATQFTDHSTGAIQSRNWQIASASFNTLNPAYTFSSSGNFAATLTVTGNNLCTSVKAKQIIVPVAPALDFTATNLCTGSNSVFTDITSSTQDIITSRAWDFSGSATTGNPVQFNFKSAGTIVAKLITTHFSGCSYSVSKSIVINNSPIAAFTAMPDRGAAPLIVQLSNTSQQATSYSWRFNDKVMSNSTLVSPTYTFTSVGDYSIELTALNGTGCSSVLSVPIKVLIPSPDLVLRDFRIANDPTGKPQAIVDIFNNGNVPVTSAAIDLILSDKAVLIEKITINLNPGQAITKTLASSIPASPSEYNFLCARINLEKDVRPFDNSRCLSSGNADYFFEPFPDPVNREVNINWISASPGLTRITIVDAMGRPAYTYAIQSVTGLNQGVLDISFLASGIYYVTVESQTLKKTMRILKL